MISNNNSIKSLSEYELDLLKLIFKKPIFLVTVKFNKTLIVFGHNSTITTINYMIKRDNPYSI